MNRVQRAAYAREYNLKNREKLKEYKRNWNKNWRLNNPELARIQRQKSYQKNRIRIMEYELRPDVKKKKVRAVAAWRLRNPEKNLAHRAVFCALRNGTLEKEPCFCGETKVQAHHDDYSKPLDVIWLCKAHHAGADELRRDKEI